MYYNLVLALKMGGFFVSAVGSGNWIRMRSKWSALNKKRKQNIKVKVKIIITR